MKDSFFRSSDTNLEKHNTFITLLVVQFGLAL